MSNIKNAPTLKGQIVVPDVIHGKSAYELAVMNGFDGTEAEWLESLVGIGILRVDNIRAEGANAVFDIVLTDGTVTTVSVPTIYLVNGGIVQYTGDSEAVAMSQKAVTLLFNSLIERLEAAESSLEAVENVLAFPELVGTWRINSFNDLPDGEYKVNFTTNSEVYSTIKKYTHNGTGYVNFDGTQVYEVGYGFLVDGANPITISSVPIIPSTDFVTWFKANTTNTKT